jgi:hypothetical protein
MSSMPGAISALPSTLIFLHIPKTAGTTFQAILKKQYGLANAYLFGQEPRVSIEAFKQLSAERRAQLRLVSGHMSFGLHSFLAQPSAYITFLRDPASRVVSTYHYIRRTPHHTHFRAVTSPDMDLEQFARSSISKIGTDNGQVRMLAGVEDVGAAIPFGECTEALLTQAQANIQRHFPVVGVTELFDESLMLMRRRFGWRLPLYRRQNVTERNTAGPVMSQQTLQTIQARNSLDMALYTAGRKQLQAEIGGQGPAFLVELRLFRWLNALYQRRNAA